MLGTNDVVAVIGIACVVLLILRPGTFSLSWKAGRKSGRLDYKATRQNNSNDPKE
jgi:hypothetical protein